MTADLRSKYTLPFNKEFELTLELLLIKSY